VRALDGDFLVVREFTREVWYKLGGILMWERDEVKGEVVAGSLSHPEGTIVSIITTNMIRWSCAGGNTYYLLRPQDVNRTVISRVPPDLNDEFYSNAHQLALHVKIRQEIKQEKGQQKKGRKKGKI